MSIQGQSQAAPAYFQALLDRGQKRPNNSDEPQLQLGLGDIARKVRNLGKGFTDARAHYLLSGSGVNTSEALRDLEELAGTKSTIQPPETALPAVKETLADQHQNDFQKMVNSHIQQSRNDFDSMVAERLHGVDWDYQRERIFQHFGLKKPENLNASAANNRGAGGASTFGRSSRRAGPLAMGGSQYGIPGMSKSIIGSVGPRSIRTSAFGDIAEKLPDGIIRPAPEDSVQRRKQDQYAERVKDLNVARLQEKVYPILTKFAEVEAEPSHEDTSMLVDSFKLLIEITGEDASKENITDPGVVRERQYAKSYLDDNPSSPNTISIRKRIINGSRKFLEKKALSQIEALVARNPREAQVGGQPSALSKVQGSVRVRAARKELGPDIDNLVSFDNGDYPWAVVFYLLRTGLFDEALAYVYEHRRAFSSGDSQFLKYLTAYVNNDDHRLPADLQTAINNEYNTRHRIGPEDQKDPYRMLCYKVIGRCDLVRRNLDNISNDMMDWMWLQFALGREFNRVDEFAHESFGLDEIRVGFREVGERFFGPGSDIANGQTTWFFMQTLAGLFEKAVADLYPHNYVSAVHFAIALDFYGLLRVSDIANSDDLLSYSTRQEPQIAFGAMDALYTRDFRTANATAAVDYIALICLNADLTGQLGKAQRDICHQALEEVILETREYAQLLGDVRADGQRIRGAIEQRLKLIGLDNEEQFLREITLRAARSAEEQNRTTDAALLYHLCEDYNKVYEVINDALSQHLVRELGEQPTRLAPLKPRNVAGQDPNQVQNSLSLTTFDDPVQLADDIRSLYNSQGMYLQNSTQKNRDTCNVLLLLARARQKLEDAQWAEAIDDITNAQVIPMDANGQVTAIRSKAQAFEVMPQSVARTVGHVMVWAVIGLSNLAEHLRSLGYETGNMDDTIRRCVQSAKDVMVFAGLIRYKLPGRVWETLAKAGQDLGAF
ncbi:hypothetical protein PRZ48_015177 [Zasmidium cellare]|uniref:Nuclear pore protein n=1 Tax=Zasmidium cellare TaxID=395010 RepID=A0ABR0DYH6_ZASCE|nr:hypothetical protein PRZ48_015177 [Zasmidium cellare]